MCGDVPAVWEGAGGIGIGVYVGRVEMMEWIGVKARGHAVGNDTDLTWQEAMKSGEGEGKVDSGDTDIWMWGSQGNAASVGAEGAGVLGVVTWVGYMGLKMRR